MLGQREAHGSNVRLLYRVLGAWRAELGLGTPWRRNASLGRRRERDHPCRDKRKARAAQNSAPGPVATGPNP